LVSFFINIFFGFKTGRPWNRKYAQLDRRRKNNTKCRNYRIGTCELGDQMGRLWWFGLDECKDDD